MSSGPFLSGFAALVARKINHLLRLVHADSPALIAESKNLPFDFAVVDEAQDIGSLICVSSAALGADRPNAFSLLATLANASSNSRFHGKRSASIFVARSNTFASIIAPHTKSACRRTACSVPKYPMPTATARNATDTVSVFNGPLPTIRMLQEPGRGDKGRRQLDFGPSARKACCLMNSAYLSDLRRNWTARVLP